MSNKTKNSKKARTDITYTQTETSVVIEISGSAFENACKIADVLNEVFADEGSTDNTARSVVENFVIGYYIMNLGESAKAWCGLSEITDGIVDSIDTGFEHETADDKAVREKLRSAFLARGLTA